MSLGKAIRLKRLFSHPSHRLCSVAVDHFMNYGGAIPPGLADLPGTIAELVAGRPDAVTMQLGPAMHCWPPHAGVVPLILQCLVARIDDSGDEMITDPADALRLGADAFATVALVRGISEAFHLRRVADQVKQADQLGMPVILHIYPRLFHDDGTVTISHQPEDIAWTVRCGIEVGVDVIKTPYPGSAEAFRQIIDTCPVPVVMAGGPKTETLAEALDLVSGALQGGAVGATVGRNIWGNQNVTAAVTAYKGVIHDGLSPAAALAAAGLPPDA